MYRRKFRDKTFAQEYIFVSKADIESIDKRILAKYLGQRFIEGMLLHFTLNVVSLVCFLPVILAVKILGQLSRFSKDTTGLKCQKLSISSSNIDYYESHIIAIDSSSMIYFDASFRLFVSYIFGKEIRLPAYPALVVTILTGRWTKVVEIHSPKQVYCSNEYSFSSPSCFRVCHERNIELINIMHGEKVYDIVDAFNIYHRIICWHQRYEELFRKLRWSFGDVMICCPFNLDQTTRLDRTSYDNTWNFNAEICYYLQGDVDEVKSTILFLASRFKKLRLRPHPKYTSKKISENICDVHLDVNDSIRFYEYICSAYSTVLFQAHMLNKKVLIDDLSKTFANEPGRWWMRDEMPDGVFLLSELEEFTHEYK